MGIHPPDWSHVARNPPPIDRLVHRVGGRKLAFAGIGADTVSVLELALRHCVSTRNRRQFWIGLADLGSGPPNSRAENVERINSFVENAIDSTGIDRAASILWLRHTHGLSPWTMLPPSLLHWLMPNRNRNARTKRALTRCRRDHMVSPWRNRTIIRLDISECTQVTLNFRYWFLGDLTQTCDLLAMRARAAELGIAPSSCICTGDIVAYCVEPEETIAAIRDWACHVIAGNCEEQLAAGAGDCGCGFEEGTEWDRLAKGWFAFANERISSLDRQWMASLPKTLSFSAGRDLAFLVVHGGIDIINRFVFRSQRPEIAAELERADADVVIAGHCGIPFIEKIEQRVWFNPGVIGMPANDGTPDTWYGLIETRGDHIALSTHRSGYHHYSAAAAVRKWAHANAYARITGLWPSLDVLPTEERESTGIRIPAASLIVRR